MSTGTTCLNCGAQLAGRFCSHCGQAGDVHVPSTRELIHEALEGLTHSDSRIWSTLKLLLFKPGMLTLEFVAGRRARYLPPFRLYLILSVLFFLVLSFTHLTQAPITFEVGKTHTTHRTTESDCSDPALFGLQKYPEWSQRVQRACFGIVRDNGNSLLHAGVTLMSKAMFVLVPLVALFHMLLYWRPRHRYAVHLLFFLHLHAFFFFDATLMAVLGNITSRWLPFKPVDDAGSMLLFWWMITYTVLALRRVFGMSWGLTLAKALALFVVYMVLLWSTVAGVFFYSALQL